LETQKRGEKILRAFFISCVVSFLIAEATCICKSEFMQRRGWNLLIAILMTGFSLCGTLSARADVCDICGKPITGEVYIVTDQVTGERKLVCSDCIKLPRCYICGLPIKKGEEHELPDGRYLCARDAKTVVLKTDEAEQICARVKDDLDRLFARFTSFPDNVDVTAIDHIDAYTIFQSESPELLGCTQPLTGDDGKKRYKISLMTGLPLAELKETCAHEYSHTWVGENVPAERHRRIARDAEEGFCEMVGYLYMDSQNDEAEKKRVMANTYTRGQVTLFVEAEQRYGFDQVLDWMKYGTASKLEPGHLEELRDVEMPASESTSVHPVTHNNIKIASPPASAPATIKLQGILWGSAPTAIINGHSFGVNDLGKVKFGETNVTLRCLSIQPSWVFIQNVDSGQEQELRLSGN
jgi:Protein DA1